MKTMKILALLLLAGCLWSCSSKGEPSEIGQILTAEQIASLTGDDSWNGKLVAVKGYPKFASAVVRLGSSSHVYLCETPNDRRGPIRANISIHDGGRTTLMEFGGETSRNYASMTKEQQLTDATFMLDDYIEAPYGEFLFSGTLVYDGDDIYLSNVTIHRAQ